jgi:hypothetical protein
MTMHRLALVGMALASLWALTRNAAQAQNLVTGSVAQSSNHQAFQVNQVTISAYTAPISNGSPGGTFINSCKDQPPMNNVNRFSLDCKTNTSAYIYFQIQGSSTWYMYPNQVTGLNATTPVNIPTQYLPYVTATKEEPVVCETTAPGCEPVACCRRPLFFRRCR